MADVRLSRRALLQGAGASAALWALPGCRQHAPLPSPPAAAGPRYVVSVFLRGGIDAIYTTNPRTRAEVSDRVEVPYAPSAIIDAKAMPLGPHLAPLAPIGDQLAVVNGVRVHTANHKTGAMQALRLRTMVTPQMPSLLDLVGRRRDTQPLGSVVLGDVSGLEHSPGFFGGPTAARGSLWSKLDAQHEDAAGLRVLARVTRDHARGIAPTSGQAEATREHLASAAALFERLPEVPRFSASAWDEGGAGPAKKIASDLQRVLWLLEHDLTRTVFLKVVVEWDSHFRNATRQAASSSAFFPAFARFLDELGKRRNGGGTLADQTLVVCGSELGRFPALNGNLGKDHFPEAPVLFFGAGVRGGRFGATGRDLDGQPVDLTTGRASAAGRHLELDDVGATILALTGNDPSVFGYQGQRLRFLEAT
jgi:uncharacterized protein (DUF1501 family)